MITIIRLGTDAEDVYPNAVKFIEDPSGYWVILQEINKDATNMENFLVSTNYIRKEVIKEIKIGD